MEYPYRPGERTSDTFVVRRTSQSGQSQLFLGTYEQCYEYVQEIKEAFLCEDADRRVVSVIYGRSWEFQCEDPEKYRHYDFFDIEIRPHHNS